MLRSEITDLRTKLHEAIEAAEAHKAESSSLTKQIEALKTQVGVVCILLLIVLCPSLFVSVSLSFCLCLHFSPLPLLLFSSGLFIYYIFTHYTLHTPHYSHTSYTPHTHTHAQKKLGDADTWCQEQSTELKHTAAKLEKSESAHAAAASALTVLQAEYETLQVTSSSQAMETVSLKENVEQMQEQLQHKDELISSLTQARDTALANLEEAVAEHQKVTKLQQLHASELKKTLQRQLKTGGGGGGGGGGCGAATTTGTTLAAANGGGVANFMSQAYASASAGEGGTGRETPPDLVANIVRIGGREVG